MAKGEGLRELIRNSGYEIRQVAYKLGYHKRTIYYWTSGYTEPCARDMLELAKLLNVPVEQIVRLFGE